MSKSFYTPKKFTPKPTKTRGSEDEIPFRRKVESLRFPGFGGSSCIDPNFWLLVSWLVVSTHLKNIFVKMDHFPRDPG